MTKTTCSVLLSALCLLPASASAYRVHDDPENDRFFEVSAYTQPYYRYVQDPCVYSADAPPPEACATTRVPDGFGIARTRLTVKGQLAEGVQLKLTLKMFSQVELYNVIAKVRLARGLDFKVGRFKVPFSRQELTSDSRLQLASRSTFLKMHPGRQIGAALVWTTRFGIEALPKKVLRIEAGTFNGERPKEGQVNADDEFLHALRVEVHPLGAMKRVEADLRPVEERSKPEVALGAGWTTESRRSWTEYYDQTRMGADLALRWFGAFFYTEVFRYERDHRTAHEADRNGFAWMAQLGGMIPAPYLEDHVELVGRIEQWDPETAEDGARASELLSTIPGAGPAAKDGTQGHQDISAALNWYLHGHALKVNATYTHRTPTEDWAVSDTTEGVSDDVDDDSLFIQLTLRL